MTTKKFNEITEELKEKIEHIKVSPKTIITILEYIIEIVELSEVKGQKKKVLALTLLTNVINDADLDDAERELCMTLIDNGTVSDTIDLVISASRGNLDINAVIDTGTKCCTYFFFNYLSKKRTPKKTKKIKRKKLSLNTDRTKMNSENL